jgi:hypothetical protein
MGSGGRQGCVHSPGSGCAGRPVDRCRHDPRSLAAQRLDADAQSERGRRHLSPDERAAAHVILRDATAKETSPLHPEAVGANDHRLDAVAQSLGVDLKAPEVPSRLRSRRRRCATGAAKPRALDLRGCRASGRRHGQEPRQLGRRSFSVHEGTWLEYAPRVTDTKGMSRARSSRCAMTSPTAAAAERLFRADNARYLRAHGLEDSPGNLSLAHFLGKGDAAKVLAAAPDTPIERLVDPKSFAANRKVLRRQVRVRGRGMGAQAHRRAVDSRLPVPMRFPMPTCWTRRIIPTFPTSVRCSSPTMLRPTLP